MKKQFTGYFDEHGQPVLQVTVKGSRTQVLLEAIIDTGFDGFICLPVELAIQLGLELIGFQTVEYADGRRVRELVFLGSVILADREMTVEISLTNSQDTLLGTGLLEDYVVEINFHCKTVRLWKDSS